MWSVLGKPIRCLWTPGVRFSSAGIPGGVPGNNLPWRKGINSPMRFTFFWLLIGTVGFGAPWLVIRHQLLRNVTYDPPPEAAEPPPPEEDKKQK